MNKPTEKDYATAEMCLADVLEGSERFCITQTQEAAEIIADRVAEALADHIAEADKMVWQDIRTAPKDGTEIVTERKLRWLPYKKNAPDWAKKIGGRWQEFDGYGWTNIDYEPLRWMPPAPKGGQE